MCHILTYICVCGRFLVCVGFNKDQAYKESAKFELFSQSHWNCKIKDVKCVENTIS